MLDINNLRKDLAGVVARLEARKSPQAFLNVDAFTALETERKTIQMRTEELQAKRNALSKQIGQLKAKGAAGQAEADAVMAQVGEYKVELESSAARLEVIQAELQNLLLALPNLPHESVPAGSDESGNIEVKKWSNQGVAGVLYAYTAIYFIALLIAFLQAVWHITLIRHRERDACFKAFRLNHWLGFTVFAGIALSLMFK